MTADPASWAAIPNGPTATPSRAFPSSSAGAISASLSGPGGPLGDPDGWLGGAEPPAVFAGDAVVAGPELRPDREDDPGADTDPAPSSGAAVRTSADVPGSVVEQGSGSSAEADGPSPGHDPVDTGSTPAAGGSPAVPSAADVADGSAADVADGAAADDRPQARPAERVPEIGEWRGIVLVTGTDTDVGKTIATSAIAAAAQAAGLRVAVVKPGQTGTADGGPTDIDLVNRLAAPHTTRTLASYPEALAPLAAARFSELPALELYAVVDAIRAEAEKHDLVLVEGAGGLLVPMGVRPSGEQWTFADLAVTLGVGTIVVTRAGLGTLNHTALTLEALARRGVPAGVILGAWPAEPELVHWANLSELVPHLVGALPEDAGSMDPGVFRRSAPGWLTPALYGVLDDWRVWAEEAG